MTPEPRRHHENRTILAARPHPMRTVMLVLLALWLGLAMALVGRPRPAFGQSLQSVAVRVADVPGANVLTIALQGGQMDTVRLAGINVPPCIQSDAIARVSGLTLNRTVYLELASQQRDGMGNLVGYVWVDTVMLNVLLVSEGLAAPTTGAARYQQNIDNAGYAAAGRSRGGWGSRCLS
jgi:endonuclease YncB( thermonuclease family)